MEDQNPRRRDCAHLWTDKRVFRLFRRLLEVGAKNEYKHYRMVYSALCEIDSDFNEHRDDVTSVIHNLTKTCATYAGMSEDAVGLYLRALRRSGIIDYGRKTNEKGITIGSYVILYEYQIDWEEDLIAITKKMIMNRNEEDIHNPADPNMDQSITGLAGHYKNNTCKQVSDKISKNNIMRKDSYDFELNIPSIIPTNTEIMELWNSTMMDKSISKIKKMTDYRSNKIKARLKDLPTIKEWRDLFDKVVSTPWLCAAGESWFTFDWLIENDNNYIKVLEGKYDKLSNFNKPFNPNNFEIEDPDKYERYEKENNK